MQDDFYWAGTEVVAGSRAWVFKPNSGASTGLDESLAFYAVPVRPGPVAEPVPEPQTLALALLALVAAVIVGIRPALAVSDPHESQPGPPG